MGLVFTYLHPALRWLPLYGTVWIMVAGLLVSYLPFSTRLMNGALTAKDTATISVFPFQL